MKQNAAKPRIFPPLVSDISQLRIDPAVPRTPANDNPPDLAQLSDYRIVRLVQASKPRQRLSKLAPWSPSPLA